MKIGIIADTHGVLPETVFPVFREVDLILHAGDIGSEDILSDLGAIAPVKAIIGNMDGFPLVSRFRQIHFFQIQRYSFCMVHAIGSVKHFAFELLKMKREADIVVFGHSHIPAEQVFNKILFLNPGSASFPRNGLSATVGMLTLTQEDWNWQLVEL